MSTRIRSWSAGFVLAAVAGVSACSPAGGSVPVPTLTSTAIPQTSAPVVEGSAAPTGPVATAEVSATASVTPSVSASPPTKDQAVEQAVLAVENYYRVTSAVNANPSAGVDPLAEVAVGNELADSQKEVFDYIKKGRTQVGEVAVISTDVFSIDLMADMAASPPHVPSIVLNVCYDVSKVDVIGPDGKSTITPTRPNQALSVFTLVNTDWPSSEGWRVSETVTQLQPC